MYSLKPRSNISRDHFETNQNELAPVSLGFISPSTFRTFESGPRIARDSVAGAYRDARVNP